MQQAINTHFNNSWQNPRSRKASEMCISPVLRYIIIYEVYYIVV